MSERFDSEVLAEKIDGLKALMLDKFDASEKKHTLVFEMLNEKIIPAVAKIEFLSSDSQGVKNDLKEHLSSHWKWVGSAAAAFDAISAIVIKLMNGGSK